MADFEVGEWLTGGGVGRYRALAPGRLKRPGEHVVVHVLCPLTPVGFDRIRPLLARFHALSSPHLSRLIEAGYRSDRQPQAGWYVTEDLGSTDLTGPHDQTAVLAAVAGAARGVHALHQAGLTHGDISATTVHPRRGGGVVDLPAVGVAAIGDGPILKITDPVLLDTMDPAVAQGQPPSRASDVYALGAVLHRAITGHMLHPGLVNDKAFVALQRVAFEPADPAAPVASTRPEERDAAVMAAVASCVARDPSRRPASAADVADLLDTLVARP